MTLQELETLLGENKGNVARLKNAGKNLESFLRSVVSANEIAAVDLTAKLDEAKTELIRVRDVLGAEAVLCEDFLTSFKS